MGDDGREADGRARAAGLQNRVDSEACRCSGSAAWSESCRGAGSGGTYCEASSQANPQMRHQVDVATSCPDPMSGSRLQRLTIMRMKQLRRISTDRLRSCSLLKNLATRTGT